MKKIAVDLDGVVFDSEFQKRYNWSEEESKYFYDTYAEEIVRDANLMPGADIILNKLKDKYEFIVVTSRNDLESDIAREKFSEFGFPNIKIFNNEHHKIDRLIEEKVDYVIDDDPIICSNALYLKNNASNKVDKDGVINVNNWGEIYKYLMLTD